MAFNDTYRESIQTKHIANVGFTSTAKGVTNEGYALVNPHQVLASQIPAVDVVGTYGPLVADGIGAGLVEEHIVELTADPTVNNNQAWIATEDNCTTAGHSARGAIRLGQWMRYAETQYKLRLFEDTGAGAPDYTAEILPSEVNFNWEYDASAGVVYFDEDPSTNGKTLPLWGVLYTYVGASVEDGLGATTSGVGNLTELFEDTNEPSGFIDRTSSTISFSDAGMLFTISGTEYSYYIEGEKHTKSGAESVTITDVEGMHYIYYDGNTLTHSATWSYDYIYNKAYVSAIYWDATNNTAVYVGEERHGITMDGQTHAYLHSTLGTQFVSGLSLTDITTDQDGSSDTHAQFGIESGYIRDEDILVSISSDASPTNVPVFYRTGASGLWRHDAVTNYPVKTFGGGSGFLSYNQFTSGEWQQTEVADGNFVLTHLFATNDVTHGIIAVQGQATYPSISDAHLGATEEMSSMVLGGLPFAEFTPIATVIYQTGSAYSNTIKARTRTTDLPADYVDWRFAKLSPIESSVQYHSNLAGLADANAHPASAIYTDTTNFNGVLSVSDATVHAALNTLDDHLHDSRYYTETEIDVTVSGLQSDIDSKSAIGHTHSESDITDLDKYTRAEVDSLISTTSGTLQDQIDALDDTYATDAELTAVSGTLQDAIDQNTSDITALDIELTTASGVLQDQIDALDVELTTASGVLQTEINNNYNTLVSLVDTTSGTLQSEIDALDSSLTDAIVWEVVDTPTEQIRPKAAHQGKAIYSAGNLTIGGDLTVSGTTTTVHSEELTVTDKTITVNAGEVGAGITGSQYAGIEVDRGSETDYMFVFDEVQDNFRVGISGSLQAVATREDVPNDGYVAVWNASAIRFDTTVPLDSLATDVELSTVSGVLQGGIDSVSSDLANNYYTITELDSGQLDNRYYTETEMNVTVSGLQSDIDSKSNIGHTHIESDITDLDKYTQAEVDSMLNTLSGTLQTDIDNNYTTLDNKIDTTSGTLQQAIDDLGEARDEFIELTDTISSYNEGRILYESANAVVDDALFTYASGTQTLNVPNIDSTGNISLDGTFGFDTGATIEEFVTSVSSSSTDVQVPTAKAVYDYVDSVSGTLQTQITSNDNDISTLQSDLVTASGVLQTQINTLDIKIDTASGTLQTQINNLDLTYATDAELAAVSGTLQTEITNNYNTLVNYIDTASGTLQSQVDALGDIYATDAELAAVSGTLQDAIDQNASDISNLDIELTTASGYLQTQIDNLDSTYATDSELSTAVSNLTNTITTASGYLQDQIDALDNTYATDAELAAVSGTLQTEITNNYNLLIDYVDTASGTLQSEIDALDSSLTDAIIWEVVNTPTDQIRPKLAHQGKALYTAGNLTIGGDLTVSGTTTTVHSQELTVTDKVVTVNAGEVGAGITGDQYAGIEVDRGSETNYMFVFDEVQDNFRVGISGSLQAVATREDVPNDGYVAVWNASAVRFDTTTIALANLATDAELASVSGTLQDGIDAVVSDLANNYYTITELDNGQLDNRYYTETEIDSIISTTSGTLQTQINNLDLLYATDSELAAVSGTLQYQIDNIDSVVTANFYTKTELDNGQLDNRYYTESETDTAISNAVSGLASETYVNTTISGALEDYYTSAEVDVLLSALSEDFLGLTDTIDSYNAGRVLFTTASGVVDSADFTFDSVSGTLHTTSIQLGTGGYVNEVTDTVSSGSTGLQIPTAAAVQSAIEANIPVFYNVALSRQSSTVWTYGTGFTELPNSIQVYFNGVLQKASDSSYYTVAINGGAIEVTFAFSTYTDDWANITFGTYPSSVDLPGTVSWEVVSGNGTTAVVGGKYLLDSSGGAFSITLPSSPAMGNQVELVDAGGVASATNITVSRNGSNIMGVADDLTIDTDAASFVLVYFNTSRGWIIVE